jgi:hypothetical protein
MTTNLYGADDNSDLENSYVVLALIQKMHQAKVSAAQEVHVWGTGTPRRELLFTVELADACHYLMEGYDAVNVGEFLNVGVGKDLTIRELAELIAMTVGYQGSLRFIHSRPDDAPRKLLDVTCMTDIGWLQKTTLKLGHHQAYQAFLASMIGISDRLRRFSDNIPARHPAVGLGHGCRADRRSARPGGYPYLSFASAGRLFQCSGGHAGRKGAHCPAIPTGFRTRDFGTSRGADRGGRHSRSHCCP